MTSRTARRPRPAVAIAWAVAFLAIGTAWFFFFVTTELGQRIDSAAMLGALGWVGRSGFGTLLLARGSTGLAIAGIVLVAVFGLARRRYGLLFGAAALLVGANVTTQVLKRVVLDRPDLGVTWATGNSFPSGHTTLAASIALAAILVVPVRGRMWAAWLGAAYTLLIGVAVIVLGWHRPADVIGALAVCGLWACLVLVVWGLVGRGLQVAPARQHRAAMFLAGTGGGLLGGACVLGAIVVPRLPSSGQVTESSHVDTLPMTLSWLAGLASVAGLTLGALGIVVLLLSRARRR